MQDRERRQDSRHDRSKQARNDPPVPRCRRTEPTAAIRLTFARIRSRRNVIVKLPRRPVERRRHARPPSKRPELTINIAERWQVQWWCEHFRVTHRQLFDAIAAVGVSAEAVRRHLEH